MQNNDALIQYKQQMQDVLKTLSHDMQNPLVNIDMIAQLLNKSVSAAQQGDQQALEQQIPKYASLITASIADVRSKFDALKDIRHWMFLETECTQINLHQLVSQEAQKLNHHIDIKLDESLCFWADEIALQRIIQELLNNALHAVQHHQGHITISAEQQHNQHVLIVTDTGYGIDANDLAHLYDPFFIALSKTTMQKQLQEEQNSQGIGLTIVQALAINHHGRVWCESVLGEGSRFSVAFPLQA